MTELDVYLAQLDLCLFELEEAFSGLSDEHLWVRPHSRLLSIGEIAVHIVHWMDQSLLGGTTLSTISQSSGSYYSSNLPHPFQLEIGSVDVLREIRKILQESKQSLKALNPSLDAPSPYRDGWKWRDAIAYQAFHIAYHTGQIYSVRHLLGHETVDN